MTELEIVERRKAAWYRVWEKSPGDEYARGAYEELRIMADGLRGVQNGQGVYPCMWAGSGVGGTNRRVVHAPVCDCLECRCSRAQPNQAAWGGSLGWREMPNFDATLAEKEEWRARAMRAEAELKVANDRVTIMREAMDNWMARAQNAEALVRKIQAIVAKAFPQERWADFDVLDQGVCLLQKRAIERCLSIIDGEDGLASCAGDQIRKVFKEVLAG